MKCIYCGGPTEVTNSRHQKHHNAVWRRRHCRSCDATFTTHETAALARSWAFVQKDGSIQPFIPEKLFLSLYDALRHRQSALDDATSLLSTINGKMLPYVTNAAIQRIDLITEVTAVLKRFDTAASVSYAAYHPA